MEKPLKKSRILQVCRLTPLWGMDLFQEITHAFATPHDEVTTIFLAGEPQPALKESYHGKVIFFALNRHSVWWRWQAFWRLRKLCKTTYFDIVICHHYKPTLIMHWVAMTTKIGRVFSMHHNFGNFRRKTAQWWLQRFKKRWHFITVSAALKQELIDAAIPSDHITIIHNTIDMTTLCQQKLSREEARKKLHLPPQAFIFGTLGRLVHDKGHTQLIAAFKQLLHQYSDRHDIHLVIIGTGPLEIALRQEIQHVALNTKIHLITDIATYGAHYLPAFDVFVLPSRQEAFGLVLLEAMCAALPIIATNVGGIPEAAGPHALLIPANNTTALTQALQQYLEMDENQRRYIGQQNVDYVMTHFSLENYYRRFRALSVVA